MSNEQIVLADEFRRNEISKKHLRKDMFQMIQELSEELKEPESLTEFWYDHERRNGMHKE